MQRFRKVLGPAIVLGGLALATPSHAGIFRAYLSLNGSDANPCTLPAPCRLLPAALAAVNDGGEIWMLDSANFNASTVTINKSVTILAIPGALGSIVANNGDAMFIDAGLSRVTLRNLVVLNLAGAGNTGVRVNTAAGLTVEGSEFYGLINGISVTAAGSSVVIRDSTIRDSMSGVVLNGAINATLQGVSLLNHSLHGVAAMGGARVSVSKGSISGCTVGIMSAGAPTAATRVTVNDSVLSENVTAVQVSTATNLGEVVLGKTTLVNNVTGVNITDASSVVHSRQNNAFKFNVTDVLGGGLTATAAQ